MDQLLIGIAMGELSSHFFHFCFKPYFFDPAWRLSGTREGTKCGATSLNYFLVSLSLFVGLTL